MVAAVEVFGGHAAFAARGEPGWHNLGTVFEQDADINTAEMLDLAHLSKWNVRLAEIEGLGRTTTPSFEVIRTNPFDKGIDRLGVVKSRYKTYQNEELFAFGDNIIAGGGLWETGGSIKEGRVVFGSLVIDRDMVVGAGSANDTIKTYLLVNTSHDGSMSVQASVTPVRVVCQNTLGMALQGVQQTFKIRHTQTMTGRVIEAQKALGLTFAYADVFEDEANKLFEVAITNQQFDSLIKALYPEPEADVKGALKKWETKRDILFDIWTDNAEGPATTGAIAGTAWGSLNALTEQLDWYRNPRGGNMENLFAAQAGFDPAIATQKQKILSVVKQYAGV